MFLAVTTILCIIQMLSQPCKCSNLLKLSDNEAPPSKPKEKNIARIIYEPYPTQKLPEKAQRRYWLVEKPLNNEHLRIYVDEKDTNIKANIALLIVQTMHDSDKKLISVVALKNEYKDQAPYKVGFIMYMMKRLHRILEELFNVAMKHQKDWIALQQLKIFEIILHTNVDATNLLRNLVDIHMKNLNATDVKKKGILKV